MKEGMEKVSGVWAWVIRFKQDGKLHMSVEFAPYATLLVWQYQYQQLKAASVAA